MRVPIGPTSLQKLTACRIAKRAFNTAQGDVTDAPQLCPRCSVCGLNAKACYYRRQVTGKVCGLDFCREFAFRLRLLPTCLKSRFTACRSMAALWPCKQFFYH